jgi:hypothetical protein
LQTLGYEVSLQGSKIKFVWTKEKDPDPDEVRPLFEEINTNKEQALEHLEELSNDRLQRRNNEILNMPLEEFQGAPLAVRIWSKSLKREIWLVPNKKTVAEMGIEGIYFTGEELKHLLKLEPSTKDLQTIMDIKGELGGELMGSPGKDDENRNQ